jgi:adenylylsulfate kinase
MKTAFAIWLTGLPASGKSTLAAALMHALRARGLHPALLESDELRRVLTPRPTYSEQERETFYAAVALIARLLTDHGVPVVIDATGNRRAYRDRAREQIDRFLEVFVDCPLDACIACDPKGLYRRATEKSGPAPLNLPGVGVPYEPPYRPEVVVRSDRQPVEQSVTDVLAALENIHCRRAPPVESLSI